MVCLDTMMTTQGFRLEMAGVRPEGSQMPSVIRGKSYEASKEVIWV